MGGVPNTHHFLKLKKYKEWRCFFYGSVTTHALCNEINFIEYLQGMQIPTVYHRGAYTISIKPAVAQNDELITEAIQENADLMPTGIVRRNHIKEAQKQPSMGDVAQLTKF